MVTVMHVLLFLLHVCMLREHKGDGNVGVGTVVAGCECMGGTCGSGIVSSVVGVCEMCMCLARGGVSG